MCFQLYKTINFFVFSTMAITAFSSGALITTQGWWILNVGSMIPVALTGLSLVWIAKKKRQNI